MTENTFSRTEVYEVIDNERDYQDMVHGNHQHSLDEWAMYIARYAQVLTSLEFNKMTVRARLDLIRKITALGVVTMEQHGPVERK